MNSSPRTSSSTGSSRRAHAPWLAALAVGGTFAFFLAAQQVWSDSEEPAVEDGGPAAVAPARLRCETCGVVEAIHRTDAVDGRPAAWVFTVRLRDGSLRHSSAALPDSWQVGDRMQLIGGGVAWSLP